MRVFPPGTPSPRTPRSLICETIFQSSPPAPAICRSSARSVAAASCSSAAPVRWYRPGRSACWSILARAVGSIKPASSQTRCSRFWRRPHRWPVHHLDAVRSRLDQPLTLGYCNVGTVVAGSGVVGFHVGDLVASNGPTLSWWLCPNTSALYPSRSQR